MAYSNRKSYNKSAEKWKKRRIATLERQLTRIKQEIDSIGDLRLSFTKNGRSGTKFVNRKNVRIVRSQVKNYKRLRKLVVKSF